VVVFSQVNITTNTEETQPGTDVELTVEAMPNSYVGILGVDQSVLLLKSGNDITKVNGKTAIFSIGII
jgi:CD109 antigen